MDFTRGSLKHFFGFCSTRMNSGWSLRKACKASAGVPLPALAAAPPPAGSVGAAAGGLADLLGGGAAGGDIVGGAAGAAAGAAEAAAGIGASTASSSRSPGAGMYGGGMYGGAGSSMYGGYGGYGGGYGGGMYGMGGMAMGSGSSYADSMFRMTQMLEMNSIMLDQLQEHVSMTYNRFRDVVMWVWALKDVFWKRDPALQAEEQLQFESAAAKEAALQRVKQRVRVLLTLLGLFCFLVRRDARHRARGSEVDRAWLKAAGGLMPEGALAASS